MPTVPRLTEQRVREQALPSVRAGTQVPREAFGGGPAAAQASEAASSGMTALIKAAAAEKIRADDVATQSLYVQLLDAKNEMLYHPKEGAMSRKGKDALGALDEYGTRFGKVAAEIEKSAANDQQRALFRQMVGKESNELAGVLNRHVLQESQALEKGTFESLVSGLQNDAAVNFSVPGKVAGNLKLMLAEANTFADRFGLSPEQKDELGAKIKSNTHAAVLRRLLIEGNFEAAEKYQGVVKKEILDDDLGVLAKVRAQAEQKAEEARDDQDRQLYLQAVSGQLTPGQVDSLFMSKRIDKTMWNELRSRALANNDDPAIPEDQKSQKFLELLDAFKNLRGADVDDSGKLIKAAKRNDIKTLMEFRQKVSQNARYLTEAQERAFYEFTQRNFDENRQPKLGIIDGLRAALASMPLHPGDMTSRLTGAVTRILNPSASLDEAGKIAVEAQTAAAVATNPNRALYQIGQVISLPNGAVKVVGFDKDGEPLVERIEK